MKLFCLFTSAALASLAMGKPLRDVILSADSSCQVQGGDEAANLACRVTCINQGPGWTGGYCDDKQICHCTFGDAV
ncbi:hypothetical protein BDV41DRAFT_543936 [Aspergillus transmontanensis]|uniref:Invertebrate defensins family profile domain-containing protein n=1 Tax=Aspergillus transmontanensis TaxID=1034304 RepID=A0A5N6VQC2_9EURO|nr:hypothetical protein BDV41DRAFT_543936 [Aspergillus transmontanensis]